MTIQSILFLLTCIDLLVEILGKNNQNKTKYIIVYTENTILYHFKRNHYVNDRLNFDCTESYSSVF